MADLMSGDTDRLLAAVCAAAAGVRGDVRAVVTDQVDRLAPLATPVTRGQLIDRAVARLDGLDALDMLLADPLVDEVLVNAGGEIWIDRAGQLARQGRLAAGVVDAVLERVLAPTGRRLDRAHPIANVRLPDGARLCAVVDPIAVDGTALAIRRHRPRAVSLDSFAPPPVVGVLRELLAWRCNILIAGATSSGKTSLLAALLANVHPAERVIVCEDTTELEPIGSHCLRLEARPATADGPDSIELATLVRAALRLRPDRLVVGEFRGPEALAAVEAMNTGHDGSLSTCHANNPADALRRVETLLMMAAPAWPLAAIRRQITRSIDAVVHLERVADGRRRVSEVCEVIEGDGEPQLRSLADDAAQLGRISRRRRSSGRGAS
jgi:pilus assembly protein CpaF